jgi:tetratricopeptide (TPR) repeat protein
MFVTSRNQMLAAFVLTAGALVASCSTSPAVARQKYLDSGNSYFDRKDYAQAVVEYRKSLQADPLFPAARYRLAQAYDHLGDGANAAREYVRAADLMPNDPDVQVRAGLFLLVGGKLEDAKTRAKRAIELNPKHLEAYLLLAQAMAGLKDLDAAVRETEAAISMDLGEARTYATLARLLSEQGHEKDAEEAFDRALRIDPQSVQVMTAYGKFYFSTGNVEKAEQWLKKAVETAPEDVNANRALAAFFISTNRLAEAEAPLKTVARIAPTPQPWLLLADYYHVAGKNAETRQILERLKNDSMVFVDVRVRQSMLDYADGHVQEAVQKADEVLAKLPKNARASLVKARYRLANREVDTAIGLMKDAAVSEPGWAEPHYWLGVAHRTRGDGGAARTEFVESERLAPTDVGAKLQLVQLNLLEGKLQAAASLMNEAVGLQPRNAQVRMTLVDVLTAQGQVDSAVREATFLASSLPALPQPQMQLGRLYTRLGQHAAAESAFQRAIQLSGGANDAIGGLVDARIAAGKLAEARALAEEQLAKRPNDAWANIFAARVYNAAHEPDKAEAALKRALAADTNNRQAHLELSRLYIGQENLEKGRLQLETILAEMPQELWAQTLVAMSLHIQHRLPEARQRYEAILAADPTQAIAANNLAMMMIDSSQNLDVALRLAETAKRQAPDSPEVSDTLGLAYYSKGMGKEAAPAFALSAKLDPTNPVYFYHLGLALAQAGQRAQSEAALRQAVALRKDFEGLADARRMLQVSATGLQSTGQTKR